MMNTSKIGDQARLKTSSLNLDGDKPWGRFGMQIAHAVVQSLQRGGFVIDSTKEAGLYSNARFRELITQVFPQYAFNKIVTRGEGGEYSDPSLVPRVADLLFEAIRDERGTSDMKIPEPLKTEALKPRPTQGTDLCYPLAEDLVESAEHWIDRLSPPAPVAGKDQITKLAEAHGLSTSMVERLRERGGRDSFDRTS